MRDQAINCLEVCGLSRVRRRRLLVPLIIFGIIATLSPAAAFEENGRGSHSLVAALHVHSTASTGSLTLDQLSDRARRLGIDVLIMAENFALQYEYGIPPWRRIIRRVISIPSISPEGMDRYVQEVAAAQARRPEVLLIPGVEVAPHYYWTGSLLGGDLTMHNSQRNVLVLGLPNAETYAALPAAGNPASYRYGWETVWNLTPGLLFIPAVWMWRRQHHRSARGSTGTAGALILAILGFFLLFSAWPFRQPVFSSYDEGLGFQPYQALIDSATAQGGVVIWSMPEARDYNTHSFGPLGSVTIMTRPHPEALELTTGYSGFGGLYQDTRSAHEAGGEWDRIIQDYLDGKRSRPPVLYGEIAFHSPGRAGMELDQIINVLRVRERTTRGIIEALQGGRLYTVRQYHPGWGLRLTEFQVESLDGIRIARSGEQMNVGEAKGVLIQLSVSATNGQVHPITATLVRSGQVIAQERGKTPFIYRHVDTLGDQAQQWAYRVIVTGAGEILSNPIYVETRPRLSPFDHQEPAQDS